MPYLKKVNINNNDYYYLFHTVRDGDKFRKLSKYIGKEKPDEKELEKLRKDFLKEIHKLPEEKKEEVKKPNVVAILQDLQEEKGFLSREDMIKISKEMGIPGVDISGVATFYSQFRQTKPGKYKISMCTGTACHVKNSGALLSYLEELLGIKAGQTTKDEKITLEFVNCIGACAKAPAMMINNTVYGELDKKKVKKIVESLK
ncbi:MAG: NAD(P)H-dependent oxidoreductase subunit E [Nanoarchaeota archaeon]|nr:NAD(P)H-dependent oxidoreductase subunit E [Nanoarchaeota archaeon]MBU1005941.1 NAD(P)H-dependent oxidoreductase subunit E [Nanoarchaeota archaeon]MBU1947068.1 NAD(P)H-dependent oxidoreductase subunit E [Nanoarchaeota archaeon]